MQENDGAMVRFRLVFDDRHLLDKSQRSQGLRRCWFRLKPDMKNIGELASQIRECFGIRHRIVLFMDDFVLPSFESTCIITDTDIIR
ncbi:coilin-like [Dendrobium catenatum]|uniref:coilin-like n=1 Tax=Dendrobium catenatum TaxID=906689 RepID=UPI00109FC314|nr:coilin-like [Dendrobium catenatum]